MFLAEYIRLLSEHFSLLAFFFGTEAESVHVRCTLLDGVGQTGHHLLGEFGPGSRASAVVILEARV